LHGLNASGRSPRSLTLDHFRKLEFETIPKDGPFPVSVPGCVDGWFELHTMFGSLPMTEILAPAIGYARDGYPVTDVIAAGWAGGARAYQKWPGFKETFMPDGRAPKKGEIFRNPGLARTLGMIAEGGREVFYEGEIAQTIGAFMRKHNGYLSAKDMADHTSEWVDPVSANYRGYDVWELPPNGQGIAALQILNILEGFDIKAMGFGSKDYVHHFVEAKKLAFEDRAKFYADPAFNDIPVKPLVSKEYAEERRKLIDPNQPAKTYDAGNPSLRDGDTIYLTIADKHGNMVSLIQSNFRGFGSGMCPDGLGFCLQNRGELFSLEEGHLNVYEPHKRPFHTIIPAFITKDGEPFMSFGVMGGDMQPQGHAQIVINLIDFGMNLQEAGDAPRIRHGGSSEPTGSRMTDGGEVFLEYGFSAETQRDLQKMGHKLGRSSVGSFGGYQAIMWDAKNKVYYGASESRKDGHAAGY
jgi:gamma-glutamyltranspeptidase/glutathione hydrolase